MAQTAAPIVDPLAAVRSSMTLTIRLIAHGAPLECARIARTWRYRAAGGDGDYAAP
jgi:hypothetical protein